MLPGHHARLLAELRHLLEAVHRLLVEAVVHLAAALEVFLLVLVHMHGNVLQVLL